MANEKGIMSQPYFDEARERWGDTEAFQDSERRTAGYTQSDWDEVANGLDTIMESFAALNSRGVAPDHEKPRLLVRKLQQFITERMFPCTDEILAQLGELYVADERFTQNIDKHGAGTAAYVSSCIKVYCG